LAAERGARGGGGTHDELGELTYDVRLGLSGDKPALARHEAASRVARVLLAALDQRRVDGAGAEQRVTGLLLEAGRERPPPPAPRPHGGDRVDAEIRPRAVCRPSRHLDLVRREPLVGDADALVGRLADDRGIGVPLRDEPLGADGAVLLVDDARDEDVAGKTLLTRPRGRDERRRDGPLHVVGAAAVQATTFAAA